MQEFDIKIIYEDEKLLVIDKPAGLSVHSDGKNKEFTLADWLLENRPESRGVGEDQIINGIGVERPGIVHRLDRDTSGVMVIAKDQSTFEFLKKQFQNHEVKKTYQAIVLGDLKDPEGGVGKIEVPIGRSRRDPRLRVAHPKAIGKKREALTYYKVLAHYPGYTSIEAYPRTGRTHQIRVHFKYLNHPIVGDELYGKTGLLGLERQALHACKLELNLPGGERREFSSDLPEDMKRALASLETL